jgi:hypothetical protein
MLVSPTNPMAHLWRTNVCAMMPGCPKGKCMAQMACAKQFPPWSNHGANDRNRPSATQTKAGPIKMPLIPLTRRLMDPDLIPIVRH